MFVSDTYMFFPYAFIKFGETKHFDKMLTALQLNTENE